MWQQRMASGLYAFVYRAHALDCRYYLYAVAETQRRGNPTVFVAREGS